MAIPCPVCESTQSQALVLLKDFPISNLELTENRAEALNAKVYDMTICMCQRCTHIYNKTPIHIEYKSENTTYFTNTLQKLYIETLTSTLIEKYDIKGKDIVEIGCGDGEFLKQLTKHNNQCVGYEPSYKEPYTDQNLTIRNEYFTPHKHLNHPVDWVVIRHVLEHFEDPFEFMERGMPYYRQINPHVKFLIEVPNVDPTLESYRVNDFIHEHISHFSFSSIRYLLQRLNLEIIEIYLTDNRENIVVICEIDQDYLANLHKIPTISEGFNHSIINLQEDYQHIVSESEVIAIWGAEGRGAGFIKTIKHYLRGDEIVVDSDEKKFDKFIPSIGLKISSYHALIGQQVDTIIITTALGKNNILKEIAENNINVKNIYVIAKTGLEKVM